MSFYYPDELLEEIKNSNDIVDVISEYVKLKKSGRNYFGLCPFHAEKTPSFSVSPDKQIFHCFGCATGGNVINFTAKIENLEFIEAVKFLAERAKISIDESMGQSIQPEKIRLKEKILEINIEAARFYFNQLAENEAKDAREYLKRRELSKETIKKFGIGFSLNNNKLSEHLISKGFEKEDIVSAGLANSEGKNKVTDRFRNRIMFPIFDVRDKVVGFGGRVLDNSLPKYLNTQETLVFNKRKNLYGLNLAKKSSEKTVLVVEGYMDAISLHQNGITNTVASLGTALTQEQARLLRKYYEEIVIAYDSDLAGQNAALRGLDLLSDMEIPVRVMKIVDAKDPDELIRKKGTSFLKSAVESAKSLVEFKIEVLKNQYDLTDTKSKISFLNKMAGILAKIPNSIERDAYIKNISQETEISKDAINSEIDRIIFGNTRKLKPGKAVFPQVNGVLAKGTDVSTKLIQTQKMLIALLSINDYELYQYITRNVDHDEFSLGAYKRIAEKIFERYSQKKGFQHSEIIELLDNEEDVNLYTEAVQNDYEFEDKYRIADDLLGTLKREKLETKKKHILSQIKCEGLTQEQIENLERELKEVTSLLQSIKAGTERYAQKGGM